MNFKNTKRSIALFAMFCCLQTFASQKSETTEQNESVETKHKAEKMVSADYYGFTQDEFVALEKIATTAKEDEIFDHFFKALDDKDLKRIEFWFDHGAAKNEDKLAKGFNKKYRSNNNIKIPITKPKETADDRRNLSFELRTVPAHFKTKNNHIRLFSKIFNYDFALEALISPNNSKPSTLDIDSPNDAGESFLNFYTKNHGYSIDIYEKLLSLGANPDLQSNDGVSARSWVKKHDRFNPTRTDLFYAREIRELEQQLEWYLKNATKDEKEYAEKIINGLTENLTKAAQNISQKAKNEKLFTAVLLCNCSIVEFWLNQGAEQRTCLHEAANRGKVEVVKTLLNHKVINVNAQIDNGETALHTAVHMTNDLAQPDNGRKKGIDIIKLLLKAGINTELKRGSRQHGYRAIDLANFADVRALLLPQTEKNENLLTAIAQGKIDDAKVLCEAGADVNCTSESFDSYGYTPFMIAAKTDNTQMCQLLYNAGANPNVKYLEDTAFKYANDNAIKTKNYTLATKILAMMINYKPISNSTIHKSLNAYLPDIDIRHLIADYAHEEESVEKKQLAEDNS